MHGQLLVEPIICIMAHTIKFCVDHGPSTWPIQRRLVYGKRLYKSTFTFTLPYLYPVAAKELFHLWTTCVSFMWQLAGRAWGAGSQGIINPPADVQYLSRKFTDHAVPRSALSLGTVLAVGDDAELVRQEEYVFEDLVGQVDAVAFVAIVSLPRQTVIARFPVHQIRARLQTKIQYCTIHKCIL